MAWVSHDAVVRLEGYPGDKFKRLTSVFEAFGVVLIGSYLPSGTAKAPEDEPSTNSIGGGNRLLKASRSLDGR